ncbi:MAG: SDR family oxidoreductase [Deltaproteobacteria bacterium]|nr:SDR family oxidoreductase [Deltaproteobacteria bacterium]
MNPLDLAGRVAFVTGGSRGIGWACAELLAGHGCNIAINGRTETGLAERAADLAQRFGVETLALAGDVARAAEVEPWYQAIFRKWRRLDVLVNNAGVLEPGLVGMISADLVDRVIDTNAKGAIYNLQAAARLMTRAGRGSIINMTSIIGVEGDAGNTVYAASKAAVIGMTYAAAKELAPKGVRVNAVAPGYIETDLVAGIGADAHERRLGQIGMGRIGAPVDVARAVLFLASDLSTYVTGQVLGVDGGMRI